MTNLIFQEFLIRGNFIRENAKTVTSECDFYHTPVRPVEPLSPRLLTPAPLPTDGSLQLDLKNSTMDSITYHDRNSPSKLFFKVQVSKFRGWEIKIVFSRLLIFHVFTFQNNIEL